MCTKSTTPEIPKATTGDRELHRWTVKYRRKPGWLKWFPFGTLCVFPVFLSAVPNISQSMFSRPYVPSPGHRPLSNTDPSAHSSLKVLPTVALVVQRPATSGSGVTDVPKLQHPPPPRSQRHNGHPTPESCSAKPVSCDPRVDIDSREATALADTGANIPSKVKLLPLL